MDIWSLINTSKFFVKLKCTQNTHTHKTDKKVFLNFYLYFWSAENLEYHFIILISRVVKLWLIIDICIVIADELQDAEEFLLRDISILVDRYKCNLSKQLFKYKHE